MDREQLDFSKPVFGPYFAEAVARELAARNAEKERETGQPHLFGLPVVYESHENGNQENH